MTENKQTRPLCPHLAAASLWTSKRTRFRFTAKPRVYYARAIGGAAMDDVVAL